jgi:hypothetical protein
MSVFPAMKEAIGRRIVVWGPWTKKCKTLHDK